MGEFNAASSTHIVAFLKTFHLLALYLGPRLFNFHQSVCRGWSFGAHTLQLQVLSALKGNVWVGMSWVFRASCGAVVHGRARARDQRARSPIDMSPAFKASWQLGSYLLQGYCSCLAFTACRRRCTLGKCNVQSPPARSQPSAKATYSCCSS